MYKISVSPEEIEKMPLGCFKGEIVVIEKGGLAFWRALEYLNRQKMIGFDTETRPVFSPDQPHNKVALLQLSGPDKAFLFRLNKMGLRRRLCKLLANPDIIKVGAACTDDNRSLMKRENFKPTNFVDLQQIVWKWGIRDKSVKKLAANILGVKISKAQQLSNWEADSLSESQMKYAATDAWVCLEMYRRLLASEQHPLTPEQQIPPQQLEQQREAARRREEKRKAEEANNGKNRSKKRKRRVA